MDDKTGALKMEEAEKASPETARGKFAAGAALTLRHFAKIAAALKQNFEARLADAEKSNEYLLLWRLKIVVQFLERSANELERFGYLDKD